jgi:hypothetical protein
MQKLCRKIGAALGRWASEKKKIWTSNLSRWTWTEKLLLLLQGGLPVGLEEMSVVESLSNVVLECGTSERSLVKAGWTVEEFFKRVS